MGTLQPVFARVTQRWMEFMVQIGETPAPPSPVLNPMAWSPSYSPTVTSLPRFQVVPQCPGAPPTWCPDFSFHLSSLSSPLWSRQWPETPVSVSLNSICELGVSWGLSSDRWGLGLGGDGQGVGPCMVGLLSVPPFLPPGVQSQRSSVLAPLDSWAQHHAPQWSGICCFWEGTSCSGGDQPSRVRAWPRGGELRVLRGQDGLQGICLQTPI